MAYFSHIESGTYQDVAQAASVDAYKALFPGMNTSAWQIVAVPDASVQGTAAPATVAPLEWDAYDFKGRFTQAERIAIRAAAQQSGAVYDFMDMLDTAAACGKMIVSNDPFLNSGLDALTNAGLIASGRKAQILGG